MSDAIAEKLVVLCVDDEPGMRTAVERTFADYAYRLPDASAEIRFKVQIAEDAERALETIDHAPPDIVLLDYKLPGMSGLDLLDRLVARSPETVTVFITAYASIETAVDATKRGAFDFLAKPFTPEELKAVVRRAARQCLLLRRARTAEVGRRRARHEMVSTVAHELKAPLAAIESNLNIVLDKTAGDDAALYERLLRRCVARLHGMRKLVVDLLDATRIDSGQWQRSPETTGIRATVDAAVAAIAEEAANRSIAVAVDCAPDLVVTVDPRDLAVAVGNLVSNAVKYNRDGGLVNIAARIESGTATIEVSDTGIGLALDEAERLFQDFVRIRNEDTQDILGTGLGLSIVRRIVESYGGTVSVESERGGGSRFTLVWPVGESPALTSENADDTR